MAQQRDEIIAVKASELKELIEEWREDIQELLAEKAKEREEVAAIREEVAALREEHGGIRMPPPMQVKRLGWRLDVCVYVIRELRAEVKYLRRLLEKHEALAKHGQDD